MRVLVKPTKLQNISPLTDQIFTREMLVNAAIKNRTYNGYIRATIRFKMWLIESNMLDNKYPLWNDLLKIPIDVNLIDDILSEYITCKEYTRFEHFSKPGFFAIFLIIDM